MSKKRYISDSIWTDPWFETQSPHKKLLFMYLLTNKLVSISGFYEITLRQMSFDTGISQSDISKYIADFENDKKIFYNEGMICIVNFVKNQNIKVETDNLWIGIKREISEINQEKLIGMLNYKGLIRTLQGAYKVLDIPYLTLLNSTLPNSTGPDEVFEAPFVEEIQDTVNTEDKEIPDTKYNKKEWREYADKEGFASYTARVLIEKGWKPDMNTDEFTDWIAKFMEARDITYSESDYKKWKGAFQSMFTYWDEQDKGSKKKKMWLSRMTNQKGFKFNLPFIKK